MNWNLKTYSGVIYDNYLWFSNNTFNGLFRMNVSNYSIEFIDFFPELPMLNKGSHKRCFSYQDTLIFIPAFSDDIYIYHIADGSFEIIPFDESGGNDSRDRIGDAVLADDKIYIFSWLKGEPLFVFDLENNSLNRCREFEHAIENENICINGAHILARCALRGTDTICFGVWDTDIVAEWNIYKNTLRTFHTGIDNIFSVSVVGDDLWILTRNSRHIYRCDNAYEIEKYPCENLNCGVGRYYSGIVSFCDKIIGFPAFADKAVYLTNNGFESIPGQYWPLNDEKHPASLSTVIEGEKLLILPFSRDGVLVMNAQSNSITQREFALEDPTMQLKIISRLFDEESDLGIVYENDIFTLQDFVAAIVNR